MIGRELDQYIGQKTGILLVGREKRQTRETTGLVKGDTLPPFSSPPPQTENLLKV